MLLESRGETETQAQNQEGNGRGEDAEGAKIRTETGSVSRGKRIGTANSSPRNVRVEV
jgi:hypothetical protein